MKPSLSLRVSQQLALTPQLQQSIRLLQLSTLEMAQEVEQMLGDNPFLELDGDAAESEQSAPEAGAPVERSVEAADAGTAEPEVPAPEADAAALEWEGDGLVEMRADDAEWGGDAPARGAREDDIDAIELAREPLTLQAHLHRQALALRLDDDERAALYCLIESLDEDGYLADPLSEIADSLLAQQQRELGRTVADRDELLQLLQLALHWLQQMEPAGVGARDLAECLKLQILELRDSAEARAALAICAQPLELIAKRDARKLAAQCAIAEPVVRAALALIARLEPKPGRRFADLQRQVVVPDVIVTASGSGFKVELNPEVMPRLRVQDLYASALRGSRSESTQPLQQRLQEARWFIKNIQQRFETILRVSTAIVERQRDFFHRGELAMRPLVLREIADQLGLHESTISRVTSAKYMATPSGTYELKYFFGSSLGTEAGGNASSTAVRALIRQLVAAENPDKPLSDQQISERLKEQGIECARRTVAKYRESLRIAPANMRRALNR